MTYPRFLLFIYMTAATATRARQIIRTIGTTMAATGVAAAKKQKIIKSKYDIIKKYNTIIQRWLTLVSKTPNIESKISKLL